MHSTSAVPGVASRSAAGGGPLATAAVAGSTRAVTGWDLHWSNVHWEYFLPIFVVHALACFAMLPWCFSWSGLVIALVGTHVFGMGINLGYHRLLTHRSLKVPLWLERSLATVALCCLEDTPARWVPRRLAVPSGT